MYSVKQVAELAGVSIRTLHHYDAIGLLKPARSGAGGYRRYGRDALLRLQQILVYRELGVPLADIAAILDDPTFDRLAALQKQRDRLSAATARYAEMIRTIDRTIAELKGGRTMSDKDLYSGIVSPEKQAEYEAWLEENYGPEMRDGIEQSRSETPSPGSPEMAAAMQDLKAIDDRLVDAMRQRGCRRRSGKRFDRRGAPRLGFKDVAPALPAPGLCRTRRHVPGPPRFHGALRDDSAGIHPIPGHRDEGVGGAPVAPPPLSSHMSAFGYHSSSRTSAASPTSVLNAVTSLPE